jgi:hypothetical protein
MAVADPDMTASASANPVAHAEAVAAVTLSLRPWEATATFLGRAARRLPIRRQRTSEINSGLFEYLCGNLASPCEANGHMGDDSVLSDHEDTAGGLTPLPGVEGIDEVETGPRHGYCWIVLPQSQRVGDESKTLVVGEPRRSGVPGELSNLLRRGIKRESEGRMAHEGSVAPVSDKSGAVSPSMRSVGTSQPDMLIDTNSA